jgi:hypothetical protein
VRLLVASEHARTALASFLDQEIQRALRQPRHTTHFSTTPIVTQCPYAVVVAGSLRIRRKIPKKKTKMQMI